MHDLTQGSISRHLIKMSVPMMIGMFVQGLYLFVDMYFIAALGAATVAAVSAASTLMFVALALSQMLNIGTVSLIARATGAGDHQQANILFRQCMLMGVGLTLGTLLAGYLGADHYMQLISQDPAVIAAGREFLHWYLPGLALTYVSTAIGAALRAVGVVKPTMIVQLLTVLINIILAPVLIAGWGTGLALGAAGAGLASTISIAIGVLFLWVYFHKSEHQVLDTSDGWRLELAQWRRIMAIGFPAGAEFALMFVFSSLVYFVIQDLGTDVQAGFGIGMRIMQAISLPAIALSAAIPAIAGQNLGAGHIDRVRLTFRKALQMTVLLMGLSMIANQLAAAPLVALFTTDAGVIAAGVLFIQIVSWNYLTSSVVFCCSGMFQTLGNTWPSLISSAVRFGIFAVVVLYLHSQPGFSAHDVWITSALSVLVQAALSYWFLRREYRLRLPA
ncbi:MAG TPA: MATE family efflux transporter [Rheinheimera sp.]|nr:MATE family efflux transporter [Rheinheimera sp.]